MNRPDKDTSKNIIDKNDKKRKLTSKLLPVINNHVKSSSISIQQINGNYHIILSKDFINNSDINRIDIINMVKTAISPLFLHLKVDEPTFTPKNTKNVISMSKIGIFMQMSSHYTGGRYSIFHQSVLLGEYYQVILFCDRDIHFKNDFKDYPGYKNVSIIIDSQYGMNKTSNDFDFVIGIPNISGIYASEYAKKWKIPFYCYMFESPNFVSEYHAGIDSTEEFWTDFKKAISSADIKISPSYMSSDYLKKWINQDDNSFKVLYPCMNDKLASNVMNEAVLYKLEDENIYKCDIVCITRMADFKCPMPVLRELEKHNLKLKIKLIGKFRNIEKIKSEYNYENLDIEYCDGISDTEKFKYLYFSKLMIFPSRFEAFGMPPMEALFFHKPCIVYNIPILREEVYRNTLIYADNPKDMVKKIIKVLSDYEKYIPNKIPDFAYSRNCKTKMLSEVLQSDKLSVTAGIIAFNCIDYLNDAIKSVYDAVNQIIIVEGAVKGNEKYANVDGHSTDGTYELLTNIDSELYDPDDKIEVIIRKDSRLWHDKIEMQNVIAERVTSNFYVKVDADEIWDVEVLRKVIMFLSNSPYDIIRMPFLHLWTSFDKVAKDAGGKWSTKHPRVWRWKKTFRHTKSFNHFVDTGNDNRIVMSPNFSEYEWNDGVIYHFGYARSIKMVEQKLRYYKNRNIERVVKINLYKEWKNLNDFTQPTQEVRSWAEYYDKNTLPEIMKEHIYFSVDDIRKL